VGGGSLLLDWDIPGLGVAHSLVLGDWSSDGALSELLDWSILGDSFSLPDEVLLSDRSLSGHRSGLRHWSSLGDIVVLGDWSLLGDRSLLSD
jgi:hypothetical protein